MIERDPNNRNWRLVCHACGFRYPMNAACKASCCAKPQLHIHNTDKPCVLCFGRRTDTDGEGAK